MVFKYLIIIFCVAFLGHSESLHISDVDQVFDSEEVVAMNEINPIKKVKIEFFYETLFPPCKEFLSTYFMDTVLKLAPYLNVGMFPFGDGWILENGVVCPDEDGKEECYGEKLHACALYDTLAHDFERAVRFTACLVTHGAAGHGSDDAAADQCGKLLQVDSESIKQCAKGEKGEMILKAIGEYSLTKHYYYVPFMLINDKEVTFYKKDFMKIVCAAFENRPKECEGV